MKYKNRIKEYRIKKGYTRNGLALMVGVTKSAVINWECRNGGVSEENAQELLKIFGLKSKEQLFEF